MTGIGWLDSRPYIGALFPTLYNSDWLSQFKIQSMDQGHRL